MFSSSTSWAAVPKASQTLSGNSAHLHAAGDQLLQRRSRCWTGTAPGSTGAPRQQATSYDLLLRRASARCRHPGSNASDSAGAGLVEAGGVVDLGDLLEAGRLVGPGADPLGPVERTRGQRLVDLAAGQVLDRGAETAERLAAPGPACGSAGPGSLPARLSPGGTSRPTGRRYCRPAETLQAEDLVQLVMQLHGRPCGSTS